MKPEKKWTLVDTRRAFWHFRKGGLKQLRKYLHARRQSVSKRTMSSTKIDSKGQVARKVDPWRTAVEKPRRPTVTAGVILDDFSRTALAFEWQQVELTKENWKAQVVEAELDLLFVESAWNGNGGKWKYAMTGASAPHQELVDLIDYCRDRDIPTIFWNKEDPAHYEDFIETARLFDFVYTTDADLLPNYKEDLGHDRVQLLAFAAQASLHNPVRLSKDFHQRDIAFGGMYFSHRHADRRRQMDILLGAALDVSERMDSGLEIYSRFQGSDSKYNFPEPYDKRVIGSLSYDEMLTAYRLHKVFLNVNTVTTSRTMCARRVFEIVAVGTPVVSTPSTAIANYFPNGGVIQISNREEAGFALRSLVRNEEFRLRTTHAAQRDIWRYHTYERRIEKVLCDSGIEEPVGDPPISITLSTNRPTQLKHAISMACAQEYDNLEILIGTHGFELSSSDIDEVQSRYREKRLKFIALDAELTLGECLNALVTNADGDYIAKFDDDDFYGANYILDQYYAMKYSSAELVGKGAHYVYDDALDMLMLKNGHMTHRYSHFVAGPTLFTSMQLLKEIPFEKRNRGEDSALLRKISSQGGLIYSSDPFNFMMHRRDPKDAHEHNHTWGVGSWELFANSKFVTQAMATAHVVC